MQPPVPAEPAAPPRAEVALEPPPLARSPSKVFYGWWIVAASAGIQLLQGASMGQAFGAYLPVLRDSFGWSTTSLTFASSLREMETGIVGPIQGWLLQRFGPRRICTLGVVIFAGGLFLFSRVQSLPQFYAAFFVMSVGMSLSGYLTLTFVTIQWFERRRATALSLMATGGAVGGVAVRLTVASIEGFGWRETATISSILVLGVGLLLTRVIRFQPADVGLFADGEDPSSPSARPLPAQYREVEGTRDFTLREALRTRAFWFVSFGHGSALFVVAALNVHYISHLKALGYTLGDATTLFLLLPFLFLIGTLAGGPLGDRFSKRWIAVGCMFAHAAAIGVLAYAASTLVVVAASIVHGLAWGLRGPQMAAIRADYFGRTAFGTIMGVSNTLIIIGTILGPIIAGYAYDQTGSYRLGFVIVAGLASAGTLFFMLAPKPGRPLTSPEVG